MSCIMSGTRPLVTWKYWQQFNFGHALSCGKVVTYGTTETFAVGLINFMSFELLQPYNTSSIMLCIMHTLKLCMYVYLLVVA